MLNRLLTQMEGILEINGLNAIAKGVVETARETLIVGYGIRTASNICPCWIYDLVLVPSGVPVPAISIGYD